MSLVLQEERTTGDRLTDAVVPLSEDLASVPVSAELAVEARQWTQPPAPDRAGVPRTRGPQAVRFDLD